MRDFDTRLRERLERLDAAVPAPRPPEIARARSRRPKRRKGVLLLAAAALLLVTSAATAQRLLFPDVPEPALEAALEEVFAGPDCLTATDAGEAIQARLDALDKANWVIESRPGAKEASCVSSFIVAPLHAVVLVPGISQEVAEAMEAVADELLRQCLGRADAIQLVSSALTSVGTDDFVVRADPWGPQGAPMDKIDDYRRHVEDGCFVYVGSPTREADGTAVHDLWGPWP